MGVTYSLEIYVDATGDLLAKPDETITSATRGGCIDLLAAWLRANPEVMSIEMYIKEITHG